MLRYIFRKVLHCVFSVCVHGETAEHILYYSDLRYTARYEEKYISNKCGFGCELTSTSDWATFQMKLPQITASHSQQANAHMPSVNNVKVSELQMWLSIFRQKP